MERRRLGNSDLELTPLGFGAWAAGGGGWWGGYGDQDDADSLAAIERALDAGINWIDTAPVYGLGRSETVVARALRGLSEPPYVFTKAGLTWDDGVEVVVNLDPTSIRREVEDSLRRLELETIDLYQVHWPEEPADDRGDLERAWTAIAELQQAGKLRWIGVSNFDVGQLERVRAIAPVTSLQPPYSLLKREIEAEILPYCRENGIGVLAYSPMASGLLSGSMTAERAASLPEDDWRRTDANFSEPALSRNLAVTEVLRTIADRRGASVGAAAIAWALRDPVVTAAIVGFRKADHVDDLVRAVDVALTEDDLAGLEAAAVAPA